MRTSVFAIFILISAVGFGQDSTTVKGNRVTIKEIGPVWPGCEGTRAEKKSCFQQKLILHISEHFDFSNGYTAADKGTQIVVDFVINEHGMPEIRDIEGGSNALQKEAKRVIMLIPKMKPGTIGGEPTETAFTVPFNF